MFLDKLFGRKPEKKISKENAKQMIERKITGAFRDDDRVPIEDCIPNAVARAIKLNDEQGYGLSSDELQETVALTAMYHSGHRGGPAMDAPTALTLVKKAFAERT